MPYTVSWYLEPRIVLVTVTDDFSLEEMQQSTQEIREHLVSGQPPVHVIVDTKRLTSFPTQVLQVKTAVEDFLKHPSMGYLALVGQDNPMIAFVSNVVIQLLKANQRRASSIEEAYQILVKVDDTLPAEV